MAERLDTRARYVPAMEEYLSLYGYNINKPLFDFAVSLMEDRNGNKAKPVDKEKVYEILKANSVELKRDRLHNGAYAYNMGRNDYLGSSITDEAHLAKFVKDYIDDIDGARSRAFDEFLMKCVALGIPIEWSEML